MLSEDEGIKAMQFLLSMNGESEPEEVSRENWNRFTDWEKQSTEDAYNTFKPKEN